MRASFTDDFTTDNPTEMLFYKMLALGSFHNIFDLVHENIEEFINIHLFVNIGWFTLIILESMAKCLRIIALFFAMR